MGIRSLNKYLYNNCSKSSIRKIFINELKGKTIVIDTSIYIYKYLKEDKLEENFTTLINSFLKNGIRPIFIFDGKTPANKIDLVKERSKRKKDAESEYTIIKEQDYKDARLIELKKRFVRVRQENIDSLKNIMHHFKVETIQCEWEADSTCANYVKSGVAWACLSDDMDMLVYGCGKVIRDFSLKSLSGQFYMLPNILKDLKLSMIGFRDIMVISGTDYSSTDSSEVTLDKTLSFYSKYQEDKTNQTFYQWLLINSSYIRNYDELIHIHKLFC
jgi:flap endonuclease-1